jgi:hypothetical protein
MVKEGSRKVEVIFNNEYIATPVVNTSISFEDDEVDEAAAEELFTAGMQHIVVNKSVKGFTILLNKNAPRDIRFSWSALSVKDAKIFESLVPGLTIDPTPTPDPGTTDPGTSPETTPDPGAGDQTPAPDPTPDPGTVQP